MLLVRAPQLTGEAGESRLQQKAVSGRLSLALVSPVRELMQLEHFCPLLAIPDVGSPHIGLLLLRGARHLEDNTSLSLCVCVCYGGGGHRSKICFGEIR